MHDGDYKYTILVGNLKGVPSHRWEDNIKVVLE
jgi:hypothetical protein